MLILKYYLNVLILPIRLINFVMVLCLCWYYVDFEFGNALLEFSCFADSTVGPDSALLLLLRFLLKIRSVRILDTIVSSRRFFGCSLRPWTPLNSP